VAKEQKKIIVGVFQKFEEGNKEDSKQSKVLEV